MVELLQKFYLIENMLFFLFAFIFYVDLLYDVLLFLCHVQT